MMVTIRFDGPADVLDCTSLSPGRLLNAGDSAEFTDAEAKFVLGAPDLDCTKLDKSKPKKGEPSEAASGAGLTKEEA